MVYRLYALNKAKLLIISQNYNQALLFINKLLKKNPNDIDAIGLKGCLFEFKALSKLENEEKLKSNKNMILAGKYFQLALDIDPSNIYALKDMADHLKNIASYQLSIEFYNKLLNELNSKNILNNEFKEIFNDVKNEMHELKKYQHAKNIFHVDFNEMLEHNLVLLSATDEKMNLLGELIYLKNGMLISIYLGLTQKTFTS